MSNSLKIDKPNHAKNTTQSTKDQVQHHGDGGKSSDS